MARRPSIPSSKQPTRFTADQLHSGIKALERRIRDLRDFDPMVVKDQFHHPELDQLKQSIDATLVDVFGSDTVDYDRYKGASVFRTGPLIMGGGARPTSEVQRDVQESKERNIARLEGAVKTLKERLESTPSHAGNSPAQVGTASNKVFIVHGHDKAALQSVARFIEKVGLTPIILGEHANQGRTIIEKFEAHSDVGFAVVLLTPDDECVVSGITVRRARQNVILELGYFIGKLTRARVCPLMVGKCELPSDVHGIVYTPMDEHGAWQFFIGERVARCWVRNRLEQSRRIIRAAAATHLHADVPSPCLLSPPAIRSTHWVGVMFSRIAVVGLAAVMGLIPAVVWLRRRHHQPRRQNPHRPRKISPTKGCLPKSF